MWLFVITLVFSVLYLVAYPGMGSFEGKLRWSSDGQYRAEVAKANRALEPVYARFATMQPHEIAADPQAQANGYLLRVERGDACQARGDVVERLVPAHAREAPLALATDALQRIQHALGVVRALQIPADLRAQAARGRRMLGIAGDFHRHAPAIVVARDRHEHRARVGAVVRAGGAHDLDVTARGLHAAMLTHASPAGRGGPRTRGGRGFHRRRPLRSMRAVPAVRPLKAAAAAPR